VEQPIGQNVTPTTPAAGTDPAFFPGFVPQQSGVPGSTGTAPDAPEDVIPAALKGSAARKPAAGKAPEPKAEPEPEEREDTPSVVDATTDTDTDDVSEDADADPDADDGKPVFEASDRRAAIIADRRGVTFTLDEETAEFGWDEIGAVEIDTPRFGKRFGVTVYTSSRRWFQCDVEAASRSQLKTWTAELDAVLDARFEDDKPELDEAAEADDAAEDETEPQAEAEVEAAEEPADAEDAAGSETDAKDTKADAKSKGPKAKNTKAAADTKAKDSADA
jgi:hypothetical protein